ncbi:hypothetical protein [Cryptosporangium japonicum]|uniref:Uncharacterized protein n=1 Tax=Cryptosporangium japonicum TaxID=80872 RepID=A0ABP3E2G0_9ACTN
MAGSVGFAALLFGLLALGTVGWSIYKIAIFSLVCGLPLTLFLVFIATLAAATARGMLLGAGEAFQRGVALGRLVAFIPGLVVIRGTFQAFDEADPAKIITVLLALVIVVISVGPSIVARKSPHCEAIEHYVQETARLRGD